VFEEFITEESAPRPPAISGDLEALVVRGDSMLPKYKDGDIIYIQKQIFEGLIEDYLGEDCAVRLKTGETYIKQLMRGSVVGLYTLLSLNAPPMENVEVEWATPIAFILPARSRRLFS
jgi:repressor LexA